MNLPVGPGIPSSERMRRGPVACLECFQEIPCNPCEDACPQHAITVGDNIASLPHLDENKCTGCGVCISHCPGLAIFVVDESIGGGRALVSFPYEYLPLPQKGQSVRCTDRDGAFAAAGTVTAVRCGPSSGRTPVVTVNVPSDAAMRVRGLDRSLAAPGDHER